MGTGDEIEREDVEPSRDRALPYEEVSDEGQRSSHHEEDVVRSTGLRSELEALLLVSADPVSAAALADVTGRGTAEVERGLRDIADEYDRDGRGFVLREVAGGWRLYTHPAHHEMVERYVLSWDTHRLTQAALETLAVVAYNQPVTREGVKAIRGVNSDSAISSLVDKGLVRDLGKRSGSAILYGTTQAFLEKFGLKSIKDLPPVEEFACDEETRQLIRERLKGATVQPMLEGMDEYADGDVEYEE